jgi:hypothetical protein
MLGRLLVAEQRAESQLLRGWWRSWAGGALPHPSAQELAATPGMPPAGALGELASLDGARFRAGFLALMVPHHLGGIRMCRQALDQARDPCLRAFAQPVLHAQTARPDASRISQHDGHAPEQARFVAPHPSSALLAAFYPFFCLSRFAGRSMG